MSIESALQRGRTAAEARMVDTCTIRRITGETDDDHSGVITPTKTVLYAGKCEFQQGKAQANPQDVGEDRVLLLQLEVKLPMSVTGLQVTDEITCDTSAHDPDLPGRVFLVRDLAHKSFATARRVQVTERTG